MKWLFHEITILTLNKKTVLDVNFMFIKIYPSTGTNTAPNLGEDKGRSLKSDAYLK